MTGVLQETPKTETRWAVQKNVDNVISASAARSTGRQSAGPYRFHSSMGDGRANNLMTDGRARHGIESS